VKHEKIKVSKTWLNLKKAVFIIGTAVRSSQLFSLICFALIFISL